MILCLCSGVSEQVVKSLIKAGIKDVHGIQAQYPVGLNCGSCLEGLQEWVEKEAAEGSPEGGKGVPRGQVTPVGSDSFDSPGQKPG
jgi:bacterioferritin-associated ferredoxin